MFDVAGSRLSRGRLKAACLLLLVAFLGPRLQARAGSRDRTRFSHYAVHSYVLEVRPHPDASTFEGTVEVRFAIDARLSRVELNAVDLDVRRVSVDGAPAAGFKLEPSEEILGIVPEAPLPAGPHTLVIAYRGTIQRSAFGLFAMDYQDHGAPARVLLTDLEPNDARRVLPCWDIPAAKATFQVRVLAPPGQTALSNMPAATVEPLPTGETWYTFRTTPRMSTYLLFLGVGRFQRVRRAVAGVDLGVVTVAGSSNAPELALDAAARLLPFYNTYFGMPYPLPKLDLVAAPGAITSVAMENWGAILLSEDVLLSAGAKAQAGDARRIFATIAHEMSHQWFGNLVTMAWWDDLWLNEGFASWMDMKATEALHPEWEIFLTDGAPDKEAGMNEDEKASAHPIVQPIGSVYQAEQSFDMTTYKKGMATVQMLERYVGEEDFRRGVHAYLEGHALGNAVSGDLWAELERTSGKPVARVMRSYTTVAGVPMVDVLEETPSPDGGETAVTVRRSQYAESAPPGRPVQVRVPILLQALGGGPPVQVLLEDGRAHVFAVKGEGPVLVNAGQNTYVRVQYAPAPLARIQGCFARLPARDQLGILYDAWAFTRSSLLPPGRFLELLEALPTNADPVVWTRAIEILERIDHLHGASAGRGVFRGFARSLLQPVALRTGWEPVAGEPPTLAGLRAAVLVALGRFEDPAVLEAARLRFRAGPAGAGPEVWPAILTVTAMHADPGTFDTLLRAVQASGSRLEQETLLNALTEVEDPVLARRLLEAALGPAVPDGMGPLLVMAIGEHHPDLTWAFVMANLDRMPRDSDTPLIYVPSIAEASLRPSRVRDLERYTRSRMPAADRHTTREIVLSIQFNIRFNRKVIPGLDTWCASRSRPAFPGR